MKFEGDDIDAARVVLRQWKGDWPIDQPMMVDEVVTLKIQVRVVEVSHQANQKDGMFYRTHALHVMEVWADDPNT